MKLKKIAKTIAIVLGGLTLSSVVDAKSVVDADMSRIVGNSGSGHNVLDQCGAGVENWNGATASIEIEQKKGRGEVEIEVKGAKPNTVYTVWLRVKGKDASGANFGGSALTGGGATPLAPGSALDAIIHYSPFAAAPGNLGTTNPTNGFTTDANGNAEFEIYLDFPVIRGAYPFNLATAPTPVGPGVPVAIVNPTEAGVNAPFLIRIVSHCQDGLAHGLSPANREAWFQYP
ncbi:hypothetical protein MNBD_GAMMA15-446 [hydrothermal vent metagenome]|uniref:Uncharacterized protein n=1 Tax=hydrothermal vent metagenome TaxID=652676 RepID=A0A3B0YQI6_9ZZZZ